LFAGNVIEGRGWRLDNLTSPSRVDGRGYGPVVRDQPRASSRTIWKSFEGTASSTDSKSIHHFEPIIEPHLGVSGGPKTRSPPGPSPPDLSSPSTARLHEKSLMRLSGRRDRPFLDIFEVEVEHPIAVEFFCSGPPRPWTGTPGRTAKAAASLPFPWPELLAMRSCNGRGPDQLQFRRISTFQSCRKFVRGSSSGGSGQPVVTLGSIPDLEEYTAEASSGFHFDHPHSQSATMARNFRHQNARPPRPIPAYGTDLPVQSIGSPRHDRQDRCQEDQARNAPTHPCSA